MVRVHLYGKLRRYAPDSRARGDSVLELEAEAGETIAALLTRIGIQHEEVYHLFYNAKLLATRNTMAPWLGYQQVRSDPMRWDLEVPVKNGDRIGLFGADMAALVV